jgi:hypothetical protein
MYGCKTWLLTTEKERKTASKKKLLGILRTKAKK